MNRMSYLKSFNFYFHPGISRKISSHVPMFIPFPSHVPGRFHPMFPFPSHFSPQISSFSSFHQGLDPLPIPPGYTKLLNGGWSCSAGYTGVVEGCCQFNDICMPRSGEKRVENWRFYMVLWCETWWKGCFLVEFLGGELMEKWKRAKRWLVVWEVWGHVRDWLVKK